MPFISPAFSPIRVEVMGRLDHLVEAVYERFKDRYFTGERAFLAIIALLLPLLFSFNF